jgi:hypothetical protein
MRYYEYIANELLPSIPKPKTLTGNPDLVSGAPVSADRWKEHLNGSAIDLSVIPRKNNIAGEVASDADSILISADIFGPAEVKFPDNPLPSITVSRHSWPKIKKAIMELPEEQRVLLNSLNVVFKDKK